MSDNLSVEQLVEESGEKLVEESGEQSVESEQIHCVISIDLGIKNLGYTTFRYYPSNGQTLAGMSAEFGLWNCTEKVRGRVSVVESRCQRIREFFETVVGDDIVDHVIIERQVDRNVMAMGLMYACYATALGYTNSVVVFDPKEKFVKLNVEYSTHNKDHKKQSVEYADKLICKWWADQIDMYRVEKKKDDIADSMNQGIVWMSSERLITETLDDIREIVEDGSTEGRRVIAKRQRSSRRTAK